MELRAWLNKRWEACSHKTFIYNKVLFLSRPALCLFTRFLVSIVYHMAGTQGFLRQDTPQDHVKESSWAGHQYMLLPTVVA